MLTCTSFKMMMIMLKNLEAEMKNWVTLNCITWRSKVLKYIVTKAGSSTVILSSWKVVVVVVVVVVVSPAHSDSDFSSPYREGSGEEQFIVFCNLDAFLQVPFTKLSFPPGALFKCFNRDMEATASSQLSQFDINRWSRLFCWRKLQQLPQTAPKWKF